MESIFLDFKGFRRDINKSGLEEYAGIYCVYRCTYNATTKKVSLQELLYIGQADNIFDRLDDHERLDDWKNHLKKGEQLCYSRARIDDEDLRLWAEAALIYHYKPCENTQHVDYFGYPKVKIKLSGKSGLPDKELIVSD